MKHSARACFILLCSSFYSALKSALLFRKGPLISAIFLRNEILSPAAQGFFLPNKKRRLEFPILS